MTSALSALALYLRPDLPPLVDHAGLSTTLSKVDAAVNPAQIKHLLDALATGSGVQPRLATYTALGARSLITQAATNLVGELALNSTDWIARNLTKRAEHVPRVKAVWRAQAGLALPGDTEIFDHAVSSALHGKTLTPVPGAAPTTPPHPGTEDKMESWIDDVRNHILARTTINPSGLPVSLRDPKRQEVYVDAIVQGVVTQQDFAELDRERTFIWSLSALGLMLIDGHTNPSDQRFYTHLQRILVELGGDAKENGQVNIDGHSDQMFAPAASRGSQRISLFHRVMRILGILTETDPNLAQTGARADHRTIFVQGLAHVARKMADRYSDHEGNTSILAPMVESTYSNYIADVASGSGGGGGGGVANVEIPPLSDPAGFNDEIEPDNIRAVSTIYVSYQLEFALKSAARVLDLFVAGLLPISASDGSARELDNLYWDQDDMLDESARYSVYARTLGAPGGQIAFDVQPNSEFNTLLMRAVSAVSEFEREQSALTYFDNAAKGRRFQSTSGEFVRKAIRDFAANVSLRGWAGTAFTAERMAKQIKRVMRVLSLPSVRNAFGVTTPWQVIERVSQREFGVTVNTVLHRTLAVETQTIMGIIADNHTVWSINGGTSLFPTPGREGSDLDMETTQRLMIACQHFRAVAGVGDQMLDEYAAPAETKPMPSLPDMSGFGGASAGGMPAIDSAGLGQLRSMVSNGQTPSLEQLRAMLPGF